MPSTWTDDRLRPNNFVIVAGLSIHGSHWRCATLLLVMFAAVEGRAAEPENARFSYFSSSRSNWLKDKCLPLAIDAKENGAFVARPS